MRGRRHDGRGLARSHDDGTSLAEVTLGLAVVMLLAGMSAPAVGRAADAARARHASGVVASQLRAARHQAIAETRHVGVAFDRTADGRWQLRTCTDGNANGLRRQDIASGVDICTTTLAIHEALPGVALAVTSGLRGPDGGPIGTDPVRFGSTDLVSCSPAGTCTPGTCYVRSEAGVQYAIRLAGATGRLRILRYDPSSGDWTTG